MRKGFDGFAHIVVPRGSPRRSVVPNEAIPFKQSEFAARSKAARFAPLKLV